jgi:CRP-like cAMP-binding protein
MPTLRAGVELLQQIPIFASLTEDELRQIIQSPDNGIVSYKPLEPIIEEDEFGDFMYVVLDGSVEVFVVDDDGQIVVLSELFRGNYFGEQALLPEGSGKRNANVRANGPATLVKVAKKYFQLIVNHDNKLMLALKAVGGAQQNKIVSTIRKTYDW